jgi:hypothetical protein
LEDLQDELVIRTGFDSIHIRLKFNSLLKKLFNETKDSVVNRQMCSKVIAMKSENLEEAEDLNEVQRSLAKFVIGVENLLQPHIREALQEDEGIFQRIQKVGAQQFPGNVAAGSWTRSLKADTEFAKADHKPMTQINEEDSDSEEYEVKKQEHKRIQAENRIKDVIATKAANEDRIARIKESEAKARKNRAAHGFPTGDSQSSEDSIPIPATPPPKSQSVKATHHGTPKTPNSAQIRATPSSSRFKTQKRMTRVEQIKQQSSTPFKISSQPRAKSTPGVFLSETTMNESDFLDEPSAIEDSFQGTDNDVIGNIDEMCKTIRENFCHSESHLKISSVLFS